MPGEAGAKDHGLQLEDQGNDCRPYINSPNSNDILNDLICTLSGPVPGPMLVGAR